MSEDKETRTEKATPRQRQKFREEGKVAVSREVISLAVLVASTATLYLVIGRGSQQLADVTRNILGKLEQTMRGGPFAWTKGILSTGAVLLIPVSVASVVAALASGFSMTKGLFSLNTIKPNFSFFNPLPRLKTLFFSKETVINLLQSTGKVAVICAFTVQVFWQEMKGLVTIGDKTVIEILMHLGWVILVLGCRIVALLAVFAVIDMIVSHRRMEEQMKMSKDQIKDEAKQYEADPKVKGQQRRMAMAMATKGMLKDVKNSDVVVVNPTHYAVALQYSAGTMTAPQVAAKGKDKLAAKIRTLARGAQVPVIHNPPLTRRLYAECEVGQEVPPNLFAAVAEVLAYVYRLKGRAT